MDNIASRQVLFSGRGKDPVLCAFVQQIWLLSVSLNYLQVVHKPGSDLMFADTLSGSFSDPLAKIKAAELCLH